MTKRFFRKRRLALQSVMLSGALGAACKAPADTPTGAREWMLKPTDPPIDIPMDFMGLHSDHGVDGTTPAPDYEYDGVRSHDTADKRAYPCLQWALIETKPGEYDWTHVDEWIAANPNKTRIFVLFGCPTFYQKYPNEPWRYPYLPGGGSPPKDPQDAARFVAALLERHGTEIDYVELWNEPNFHWTGESLTEDRWLPKHKDAGFFTGTAADLAGMAAALRPLMTAKTKLLMGSWEGQSGSDSMTSSLLRYAAAPDGRGGTGLRHVQAISVHCYIYENDPNKLIQELRDYNARFKQAGYPDSMPRLVSEIGAEAPGFWTEDYPSMTAKIRNVKRWCMIPAALGYQAVYLYKHSKMRTLGAPADSPEIGQAISEMRNSLRGQRIRAAAELRDDTIWLQFEDGKTLRA